MQPTVGDVGVPIRSGGRRKAAGSAAVNRASAIGSMSANGGMPSTSLPPHRPLRRRARASAQPTLRKHLLVPAQAATCCSSPCGVGLVNTTVRACAVKLYGAFCSAKRGGDGGVKGGRPVAVGFHPGGTKYVVPYFKPTPVGLRLSRGCGAWRQHFLKTKEVRAWATGKER